MMRREFLFSEGESHRYWAIEQRGSSLLLRFGRVGSRGTTTSRAFASAQAARVSASKRIANKVKAGYVELAGAAASDGTPCLVLSPGERLFAPWCQRVPLTRPTPRPFDKQRCLEVVLRAGRAFAWDRTELAQPMTPEEAEFWIVALTSTVDWKRRHLAIAERLKAYEPTGTLDAATIYTALPKDPQHARPCDISLLVNPIVTLLGETATLDLLLGERIFELFQHVCADADLVDNILAVRDHVLLYMNAQQLAALRERVTRYATPARWPTPDDVAELDATPLPELGIAACLGMHDELSAIVGAWPDDEFSKATPSFVRRQFPQLFVLGLGVPAKVEAEMRRLSLRLDHPAFIRGWLACNGTSGFDRIKETIAQATSEDQAHKLLIAFAEAAQVPQAAPAMLSLRESSLAPEVASQWLQSNVSHAITGLKPVAKGHGKLAKAARAQLRSYEGG